MTDELPEGTKPPSLLPDTALSDRNLDRLDRAPFALSLSQSILRLDGDDSFVIGLCGPWGSGKTSVLNFTTDVLERAGGQPTVLLRFNPWWFSGRDQLLEAFLAQFTAVLQAPQGGKTAKKAASLLKSLSAGLRPVALFPIIGAAAKAGQEAVDALAGAASAYADVVQSDVIGIRKEIDTLLKDFPQRIIVVMDDIDRLAASEIAQLFLILKAVADFPKTVYLLAFDHGVVAKAINEHLGVDGRTYLEKIIQLQIDIPPTARAAIHRMFFEELDELLRSEPLAGPDLQYLGNVFHDGLKDFLTTPRAVKKLINMLRFAYPALRGEVNVVDMICIACLTTFVPEIITTIANNTNEFVGVGPQRGSDSAQERKEREAFHRRWLDLLAESERGPVERVVRRIFPSVNTALGGTAYSIGFEQSWTQQLRVCSSKHFEKFFRLTISDGSIREVEWKNIVEQLHDERALDDILSDFAVPNGSSNPISRASELLDRALLFARSASEDEAKQLFGAFMRIGDDFCISEQSGTQFSFLVDNQLRLTWILHELLGHISKQVRTRFLLHQIARAGLMIASDLVVSLGYQNGIYRKGKSEEPRDPPLVPKSFVRRFAKAFRLKLSAMHARDDSSLSSHPQFMKIVINWWRIGGKKDAIRWLGELTLNDQMLVRTLVQQISKSRMHGSDDNVAITSDFIDAKFLQNFLPLKSLRERCVHLSSNKPSWIDERGIQAVEITIKTITPQGKAIDRWSGSLNRPKSPKKTKANRAV